MCRMVLSAIAFATIIAPAGEPVRAPMRCRAWARRQYSGCPVRRFAGCAKTPTITESIADGCSSGALLREPNLPRSLR